MSSTMPKCEVTKFRCPSPPEMGRSFSGNPSSLPGIWENGQNIREFPIPGFRANTTLVNEGPAKSAQKGPFIGEKEVAGN